MAIFDREEVLARQTLDVWKRGLEAARRRYENLNFQARDAYLTMRWYEGVVKELEQKEATDAPDERTV